MGGDDWRFREMSRDEAGKAVVKRHAAHCMLYARSDDGTDTLVLAMLRHDGLIGFPGGFVDGDESWESALQRELYEEIGWKDAKIFESDYIFSTLDGKLSFALHFYGKEVSREEFLAIESTATKAKHYGTEVYGIMRVPLFQCKKQPKGLPSFLSHKFIGIARRALLRGLLERNILSKAEIDSALQKSDDPSNSTSATVNSNKNQ